MSHSFVKRTLHASLLHGILYASVNYAHVMERTRQRGARAIFSDSGKMIYTSY